MYPKTARYISDTDQWIRIEYRGYWDFARLFCFQYKGFQLVFSAPFLDIPSEYSDYFIVYKSANKEPGNWTEEYRRWEISNIVPVSDITLDESRKEYILAECLHQMFSNFEPPNQPPDPTAPSGRGSA